MAYSSKEKASWKRGFLSGLKKAMKGKTNKKSSKKSSSVKSKKNSRFVSTKNKRAKKTSSGWNPYTSVPKTRQEFIWFHNSHMDDDTYKVANRYARHMGSKFSLEDGEVRKNAYEHFQQAQNDPGFREWLFDNYGG